VKKKMAVVAVALMLVVAVSGCWGPQIVTRGFDDWLNQGYVNSPWLYGNVLAFMVWGMGFMFTNMADAFVNTYYFWAKDAQPFGSGTGTKFDHKPVTPK
jgi:hypothetical protein